jgi:hypothetical protein
MDAMEKRKISCPRREWNPGRPARRCKVNKEKIRAYISGYWSSEKENYSYKRDRVVVEQTRTQSKRRVLIEEKSIEFNDGREHSSRKSLRQETRVSEVSAVTATKLPKLKTCSTAVVGRHNSVTAKFTSW